MKKLKQLVTSFMLLSAFNIAHANEDDRKVTIMNTSEDGYMEVTYGFCDPYCSSVWDDETVIIYSKKNSSPDKPYYVTIDVPRPGVFSAVGIHNVVEKELINGKPSDKIIAKTITQADVQICKGYVTEYDKEESHPHSIIALTDLNRSPFVACKVLST